MSRSVLRHGEAGWLNPKVLSTLVIIFFCGMAFGCLCMRVYLHSQSLKSSAPVPPIEQARHVGLGTLKAKLRLTADQEQTVTKILDDYGKFYQNIDDEREDVAQDGIRKIIAVLNPEQRKAFNQLLGRNKPGN